MAIRPSVRSPGASMPRTGGMKYTQPSTPMPMPTPKTGGMKRTMPMPMPTSKVGGASRAGQALGKFSGAGGTTTFNMGRKPGGMPRGGVTKPGMGRKPGGTTRSGAIPGGISRTDEELAIGGGRALGGKKRAMPMPKPKTGGMKFTQPVMPTPKKSPMNTMRPMAMKRNPKNG